MIRHEISEQLLQAALRCANCRNYLSSDDFTHNSESQPCCSAACAIISDDRSAPVPSCTNCGDRSDILGNMVYSRDGLPFCSPACASLYPKPVSSPEVRRILWAAAATMFLVTAFLLLLIITHFSRAN